MENFVSLDSHPLTYRDFENYDYKDANSQKKPEIFYLSKSIPLQLSYKDFQPHYATIGLRCIEENMQSKVYTSK